jgi:xanthine dehydrogenase accessory factor
MSTTTELQLSGSPGKAAPPQVEVAALTVAARLDSLAEEKQRMITTQDLHAMRALASRMLRSGTPGTLSTLFRALGSTYRPLGSMMVGFPGRHAGGISGGCLEEYIACVGERETRSAPAAMLHFSTHPDSEDNAPVLGCGGSIDVLVERLTPEHLTLLEQFAAAAERDEGSLLACIVRRDGESLSVTREWLRSADGDTTTVSDKDVLVQCVPPITRLVIFGAGDDARPVCQIATSLGWHVSVADRRGRYATTARFPEARAVFACDWDEAVDSIRLSPRTAVVLMTHSLEDDARVLSLLSGRRLAYVGALGPAHRREWLLEQAAALGMPAHDPVGRLLRGPIGLDLGDKSPVGIALAITAEILAHFNRRPALSLHAHVAA